MTKKKKKMKSSKSTATTTTVMTGGVQATSHTSPSDDYVYKDSTSVNSSTIESSAPQPLPPQPTVTTAQVNRIESFSKFYLHNTSPAPQPIIVNKPPIVHHVNPSSTTTTVKKIAKSENYTSQVSVDGQSYRRNSRMSIIGASPAFHLPNANHSLHFNVRNTDKMDFNLSTSFAANASNFGKKMDAAKFKRKQRNQIYALNNLMTSLEYDNFLRFCQENNIDVKE